MEYPSPASIFFSIKQTLCEQCEIYYEREHAHFPNILVSQSKETKQRWLGRHLPLHTRPFTVSGHSPSAGLDSWGHVRGIRVMQMEIAYWVSRSHHQTNPNSSFVSCTTSTTFPSQGLNDSSSTMFPGGRGGYCSQIEWIQHLEIFPFYWI